MEDRRPHGYQGATGCGGIDGSADVSLGARVVPEPDPHSGVSGYVREFHIEFRHGKARR